MTVLEKVKELKLVPVVVLNSLDEVSKLEGLIEGGLPIAEITFRTACAGEAIKLACERYPDMLVGAGTVINAAQCHEAIACGAKFIVSPGLSEEVAAVAKEAGIPYLPGVVTPTEVMKAVSLGLTTLKFFPAANYGGLATIKSICAAFPQIEFMPTGGVSVNNINDMLAFKKIIACGGSWMMQGDKEQIKALTESAMKTIRGEV